MSGVLIRGEVTERHLQGGRPCEDRGRDGSDAVTSQGMPRTATKERTVSRALRRSEALPTP